MRRTIAFVASFATLLIAACEKENGHDPEPEPVVSTTQIEVTGLENTVAQLVFADQRSTEISFDAKGKAVYTSQGEAVVISQLVTTAKNTIAVGRLSGGTIRIDYTNGKVSHTAPNAEGQVPINIVEELSIVRGDVELMQKSYIQTADLYLGGIEWVPIGLDFSLRFTGSFDGDGYKIHDLTINRLENKEQYSGLFGLTQNSTFKNITIASGNISGFRYTAALAARTEGKSLVENCVNYATIYGENAAAGLVCNAFGGTTIHNCINYGTLSGGNEIGGIVSRLMGAKMTSCKNHGAITVQRTGGGLVYVMHNSSTLDDCINEGTVSGGSSIGGITGGVASASKLTNSINEGTIIAQRGDAGGIAAGVSGGGMIENCENKGNITAVKAEGQSVEPTAAGGIVGTSGESGIITKCINHEKVLFTGFTSSIGGIVGSANKTTITYCKNMAEMNYPQASTIGGIIGRNSAHTSFCENHAAVIGKEYVGGIAGYNHDGMKLRMCENRAPIKGGNFTGGIAGITWGSVSACINRGAVEGQQYTGGVTGATAGQFSYLVASYNTGAVKGTSEVGGVSGIVNLNGLVESCYSIGTVAGSNLTGGVCGSVEQSELTGCYWSGFNGKGIGSGAGLAYYFSDGTQTPAEATAKWPAATDKNWGINPAGGSGTDGLWWRNLGKTGTKTYPALWWEK